MMQSLVITGGEGGLARAIANAFHDDAWNVAAPGHVELDVTDASKIKSYFAERRVDLLVCAAGLICDQLLARMDEAAWDRVVDTNYLGAARCVQAVLPGMKANGAGHIILISSYSALVPPAGQAAYATAKAALLGLNRSIALEQGPSNIRVNAILPGFLETRMTEQVTEARRAEVLTNHALGRFNTSEAVARFIRHLHDALPHTSGQVFQLDSRLG